MYLGSLICMLGLLGAGIWAAGRVLKDQEEFQKVRVGVVIPDESRTSKQVMRILYAMESVNSVCSFTYLEKDEVGTAIQKHQVQAVIQVTPSFYDDVNTGVNTPVQLLIGKDTDYETGIFYELVTDGAELVRVTEAAIYAASDAMQLYETKLTVSEMEDLFTGLYMNAILTRTDTFEQRLLSPIGQRDLVQYYYISGLCVLLLMVSLNFGRLYGKQEQKVLLLLQRQGLTVWQVSGVKTCVMAGMLWILAGIWYAAGCLVAYVRADAWIIWNPAALLGIAVVCLGIAAYYHMLYSLCSSRAESGCILWILNSMMLILSGCLIPVHVMPKPVQRLSVWMPLHSWWDMLSGCMFGDLAGGTVPAVMGMLLLFEGIGVYGLCRKRSSGL